MSDKDLDRLFKKRLENLAYTPSDDAWNRIKSGTAGSQGSGNKIWLRIAAAIVLLAVIGLTVWTNVDFNTQQQVAVKQTHEIPSIKEKQSEAIPQQKNNQDDEMINPVAKTPVVQEPVTRQKTKATNNKSSAGEQNPAAPVATQDQNLMQNTLADADNAQIEEKQQLDATISKQAASDLQEAQGSTLQFDLKDFETATLASNKDLEDEDDRASNSKAKEEDQRKGLKKVADLFKTIKEEASLAELRETKNEIFALNFKKEKDEGTK